MWLRPVPDLGPFVLATTNPNKAREIREILATEGLEVELVDRPEGAPEVEETEQTLLGNARLKAAALVNATGMAAIAEDTGIEVEALGGPRGCVRPDLQESHPMSRPTSTRSWPRWRVSGGRDSAGPGL